MRYNYLGKSLIELGRISWEKLLRILWTESEYKQGLWGLWWLQILILHFWSLLYDIIMKSINQAYQKISIYKLLTKKLQIEMHKIPALLFNLSDIAFLFTMQLSNPFFDWLELQIFFIKLPVLELLGDCSMYHKQQRW